MKKYQQKLLENQHFLCRDFFKVAHQDFWLYQPIADKWNAVEHLAHLAAYQHTFYDRIFQILEIDTPTFGRYDSNNDTNFLAMRGLAPKEVWQDLKAMRKLIIKVAGKLSKKELQRTASHPVYGTLSLERWLNFFIQHENHHIFAISQLLGKFDTKHNQNKDSKITEEKIAKTSIASVNEILVKQKEELIEVYDSRNQPTGKIEPRSKVHREGLWHRTMHCWVIYQSKRGKKNSYVVFQRRSAWKDSDPNKFDTTAAGHYTADMPIAQQRFKEIEEELGLLVNETDLINVGVRINVEDFENQFFNHEFQDVYFWVNDTSFHNYKLQTEEVSGLIALEINKGLQLFMGEIDKVSAKGIEVVYEEDGKTFYKDKTFTVRREDFGQTLDNYFAKALLLAEQILEGKKYVKI